MQTGIHSDEVVGFSMILSNICIGQHRVFYDFKQYMHLSVPG